MELSVESSSESELPCWSGVWFEAEGLGYMEIHDGDQRSHRPPPGWKLESIDHNVEHSSQVYRYVPVLAVVRQFPLNIQGLLVAVCATGASVLGLPVIQAILHNQGVA